VLEVSKLGQLLDADRQRVREAHALHFGS
jgi:hypothetical protein